MQHERGGAPNEFARSSGVVNFVVQPDAAGGILGYDLSGVYQVTDVGAIWGEAHLSSSLYDVTTASSLALAGQNDSFAPNQSLTLGGTNGIYNNSGALSGMLVAGHTYQWIYSVFTEAYPTPGFGASAVGNVTLAFTDSSAAVTAVPLPVAAFMPISLLPLLILLRLRKKSLAH